MRRSIGMCICITSVSASGWAGSRFGTKIRSGFWVLMVYYMGGHLGGLESVFGHEGACMHARTLLMGLDVMAYISCICAMRLRVASFSVCSYYIRRARSETPRLSEVL